MELMLLVGFLTIRSVGLGCVRNRRCQPKPRAAGGLLGSTSFPTGELPTVVSVLLGYPAQQPPLAELRGRGEAHSTEPFSCRRRWKGDLQLW